MGGFGHRYYFWPITAQRRQRRGADGGYSPTTMSLGAGGRACFGALVGAWGCEVERLSRADDHALGFGAPVGASKCEVEEGVEHRAGGGRVEHVFLIVDPQLQQRAKRLGMRAGRAWWNAREDTGGGQRARETGDGQST